MTTAEYNKSVDLYSDNVYRFILKNIKDSEKAKDIVQDAFTKMWQKVDTVDFKKVKSYIFQAAYNTMIDKIRKDKRLGDFNEVNLENLNHSNQYSDLQEILHEALATLPEKQRSVILLRDYEGYSYEEIGEICELNESQVKVYIYRARKALKEYIGSIENVV